uniref:Guanine nucleotide binding protein (G protein), beta polypeptide 1-like n=1 Tax=Paramormyrops kingsleyae TaxID=1676925 RepID=A0A3B3SGH3_9TELE
MASPPPDPQFVLRGSGAAVNTLHFSCGTSDPPLLFSGSAKGTIHQWNLTTRRPERTLDGHSGASVIWLKTLGSRETLISQGRDSRVCTWDLAEGRSAVTDSIRTGSVGFCQCSLLETGLCSRLLAHPVETMDEVKVIDFPSGTAVCSLKPDARLGMVMCTKLWQPDSGRGPLLLVGYEAGTLALWDVAQRQPLSTLVAHSEPLLCLDFDPERLRGASGSAERAVCSWTLDGQQNLQMAVSVELVNPGISQLSLRADRKLLASAGWDHRVRLFGWKKLKPLAVLQYHTDSVLSVAFSDHADPRLRLMAAGSKDQRISICLKQRDLPVLVAKKPSSII